ncbi:hypothetical protein [Nocardia sp. XZ_19_231]|uniref:hypothetical protein n=1 Tax=Nocardia sp. XZ_19_231 TaxID=2769252 RepID=UPI00189099FE|nr:hypothetical protein [Nocardia sp. XZ_19_231]
MKSTGQDSRSRYLRHTDTHHYAFLVSADRYVISFWRFEPGAVVLTREQAVAALDLAALVTHFADQLLFARTKQATRLWDKVTRLAEVVGLDPLDAVLRAMQDHRTRQGWLA